MGSGHPRILFRSASITGGPSTGSVAPIAMKLGQIINSKWTAVSDYVDARPE